MVANTNETEKFREFSRDFLLNPARFGLHDVKGDLAKVREAGVIYNNPNLMASDEVSTPMQQALNALAPHNRANTPSYNEVKEPKPVNYATVGKTSTFGLFGGLGKAASVAPSPNNVDDNTKQPSGPKKS